MMPIPNPWDPHDPLPDVCSDAERYVKYNYARFCRAVYFFAALRILFVIFLFVLARRFWYQQLRNAPLSLGLPIGLFFLIYVAVELLIAAQWLRQAKWYVFESKTVDG